MKAPTALQRGMACLCCRKRKMKCDGARPVCTQCSKANRASECQYYEKKRTSRTQLLQAKITKLEARLRELESEQTPEPSTSSASRSPSLEGSSSPGLSCSLPFDPALFTPSDIDHDYSSSGGNESLSQIHSDPFFSGLQDDGSSSGYSWQDGLDFPPAVDDFLAPCPSDPGSSRLPETSARSTNWWENDVFCENKQMLLDIFFAHRHQCAFDVHIGRFKAALLLPAAQKPHPSLVDAVYLLACYFSRSSVLTALEPHFLKRSLRGIADALQNSDRIVHVLQASCLLAAYFFWHGRTLEGYYHSSIAARLAVGLGLHQIRTNEWFQLQFARAGYNQGDAPTPLKASVPLKPPLDEVEYAERIAAFWQIFSIDRAWAVSTGLPTALPDDDHPRSRMETMWPITIPDDPDPTLEGVTIPAFPGSHLSGSATTSALRAKAIALFERTARFSAAPTKDDNHYSLEMSLSQFLTNLSNLSNQQYSLAYLVSTADIVDMQTLIHAATIHLHRDALEMQSQSYQKCVWASNAMTSMIRSMADSDYDLLCPTIATCWRSAAEVYLRIRSSSQGQPLTTTTELIEQELDTLVAALQRLSLVFPIAGIYAAKIQDDRATTRQAYVSPLV
ncbi:hypothetical protein BC628DRAFT_1311331 [Trametes gibbosa]|uniref:Zn(2)-C6 fungal-type domain-containing protein n=1 Tax=Trametes gibbosa TaxID=160864 RepID=A0A6G6FQB6_9APHY|nr:hypothetical protein BC628DRAFT_1311331 [Trametes gibbosa]QIE48460.1 hypothetical protein [Trametes gibbosa]UVI59120.1 Zn(2)-Cys(6)18 [Trametes gibbosa]